jgi:hypothetical protein
MNDKLKPCPFCGFRAFVGHKDGWYWVYCGLENCDINPKTKAFNRKEYAIKCWNRRAENEQRN